VKRASWLIGGLLSVVVCAASAQAASPSAAASATRRAPSAASSARQDVASPLDRHVTLDLQNVTIAAALDEIARQGHLDLSFTDEVVPSGRHVTIKVTDVTLREALKRVLRGTGTRAEVRPTGTVMIVKDAGGKDAKSTTSAREQSGTIWGRVVDSVTVRPLVGALVGMRGVAEQSVTNDSGYYWLQHVPAGIQVVAVRMLGYRAAERRVVVPDSQAVRLDFALPMGMTRLQEVVTTATGEKRRLEVANDITVIHVDSVLATAPISSVTDLLETRVPGLTVQRTSGAPGDPARIRIRGVSSIYGNNDPIVIVDGVRIYSAQSDARSANQALNPKAGDFPAPSPLDQIDPQSIETIEVAKGPSAATLYGADAANGVIVITTKRGRAGPAHWRVSTSQGLSYLPGRYPDAYLLFGHDYNGDRLICSLGQLCGAGVDSLVRFQALSAPDLTVLGHGGSTRLMLGVDGGSHELAYSLTGSYDDETGILKLPSLAATQFQNAHGYAAPDWMRRPQTLNRWSGTGRVTAQLGRKAEVAFTTMLTRERQQHSSLERQLGSLMGTYVDRASETFYQGGTGGVYLVASPVLVPDFHRRVTDATTNFTNAANLTWHPLTWLTGSADAGLNVIGRTDENLLPRDMLDTLGSLTTARGNSVVSTVNLRATVTAPLPLGFHLQFATGANYTKTSISDLQTSVEGLAPGTSGLDGAGYWGRPSQMVSDVTNLGWYVEPSLAHKRFFLNAGLRFDGGSTYGSHVSLPTFPKLGGTWLVSDEPWFPFKNVFNTLRLRAAYGHAGVQPGITDRLRLYHHDTQLIDGGLTDVSMLGTLGNTKIRPERSTELEGGFDADLLNDRVSVSLSGYRKTRKDALLQVPVAPSVYGDNVSIWENVGVIRNTGLEASVAAQLLRTDPVTWSWTLGVSRNRNLVVALAPGMQPFNLDLDTRIAPGYPLYGRWARPIKGYADVNGDGIIEPDEVQVGDSLVFLGEMVPNYEASLHSTFNFLRGALTVDAGLDYQGGLTQVNRTAQYNRLLSRGANDATAPFSEQAAVAALSKTEYGLVQTINTLRFNSLSVAFNAPPSLARRVGASALSIALQGSNLGLFTNYRGKDPNVNAYSTGNFIADTGVLPQPRSWLLTVTARY
jgi:TonB-dependent SusC/RagA subfamily outer membrane receptor